MKNIPHSPNKSAFASHIQLQENTRKQELKTQEAK